MVTLSVFTPTFNRVDLLHRGYQALCRQTSHDFCWLIIDDGSTDLTKDLVESWITSESIIKTHDGFEGLSKDASWLHIRYCYKENGGLHTGYNKAIELMDTELCVCIDSDDYMPDDAVEVIVDCWGKYNDNSIAGLVGLDYKISGEVLGTNFPEGRKIHYINLKDNKQYNCDNKIVLRVDLLKKVAPQPTFPGEKNFNPIWMILKIDQQYPFVLINRNLCYVDYQEGGMGANLIKQYFDSPLSFLELRKLYISLKYTSLIFKVKNHIHLVAQSKIARVNPFRHTNNKILTMFVFPCGVLLYFRMCHLQKNYIK